MSLPIVLGGKSVSSQQLPPPNPQPENAEDGASLEPVELFQTVAVCVCPKKEWTVRVTLSFYDLLRPNGKRETTMVETRIQVAPIVRPLSSSYRETVHHLKLPDGAQDDYPQADPCALVSPDRRNLSILLFHPHKQSSALVIFQLRTPRSDSVLESNLPLPSYISDTSCTIRNCPMVATNPRFVSAWGVTAICNVPNVSPPLLLCACQDGHLVWIDYRSSLTIATGDMGHNEVARDLAVSASCLEHGTIIAIHFNGVASIATWSIEKSTQLTLLRRASTGTAVVQAPLDSPSSNSEKSVGGGAFSPKNGGGRPRLQKPLNSTVTITAAATASATASAAATSTMNLFNSFRFGKQVVKEAPPSPTRKQAKREGMDRFVLEHVKKKTGVGFRRMNAKRKHIGGVRRKSGSGNRDDTKRLMELDVLTELGNVYAASLLGPSPSSLFAVLYRPGSFTTERGSPCAAEIFCILGDGSLKSVTRLELAPERVGELEFVMNASFADFSEYGADDDSLSVATVQHVKSNKYGLEYDELTGCLAVSTMYYVSSNDRTMQSLGCIWNWRANVMGLLLPSSPDSLFSRLYFGKDTQKGPHLVHMEVTTGKKIVLRKQAFSMGTLSPPSSLRGNHLQEPCSMLLTGDTVAFPVCSGPSLDDATDLQWMESGLPSNYISTYGPPQIAALGRQHALNLAIASSSGVCILDVDIRKWRLFGSETEERTFGVLAMTWWEGRVPTFNSDEVALEHESDDLLLAIIQSINGRQYLSCWSPQRLDLAHQLIEPQDKDSQSNEGSWGMLLPKNVTVTSLSVLAEPVSTGLRRAVVFVSATNNETCQIEYVTFHLQVVQKEKSGPVESYVDQKPYSVVANVASKGIIKNGLRIAEPIVGVFLASASFRFDLSKKVDNTDADESPRNNEYIATLGVVRTPGGLEAICLCSRGIPLFSPVADWEEISRYWLSDIVCSKSMGDSEILPGAGMDVFVWAIQLIDGSLVAWSVPYHCDYHSEDVSLQSSLVLDDPDNIEYEHTPPPREVCKRNMRNKQYAPMLGVTCAIGKCSDWMLESSAGIQIDLSLGEVPGSSFGCILSAGQSSRKFHRSVPDGLDPDAFATGFLDYAVNCSGDFMLKPPAFVTSLYVLVLEAAYLRAELPATEKGEEDTTSNLYHEGKSRLSLIAKHTVYRLASSPNKDAVFMALRLLILRSVEILASSHKKLSKDGTEEARGAFQVATFLFKQVVEAVRRCTTRLQFASLFLEVGRQVEPSCFDHLFPLPVYDDLFDGEQNSDDNSMTADRKLETAQPASVADLVALCSKEGSVLASASALPLLGTKHRSRKHCEELLRQSLQVFAQNASSLENARFDFSEEEREVIGDIFRFGIKLEEAADYEELTRTGSGPVDEAGHDSFKQQIPRSSLRGSSYHPDDSFKQQIPRSSLRSSTYPDASESSVASGGDFMDRRSQLICGRRRRSSRSSILNYIVPSVFTSDRSLRVEEEAIAKAATSFIQDGFETPPVIAVEPQFQTLVRSLSEPDLGSNDLESVSGVVGDFVVQLLKRTSSVRVPWKLMTALSRLLLQDDMELSRWEHSFNVLSERVGPIDLETFVDIDSSSSSSSSSSNGIKPEKTKDDVDRVALFLAAQIAYCKLEIGRMEASMVLDLVLLLLQRLEEFLPKEDEDAPVVCVGLIAISMISGAVSDRIEDLLGQVDENSFLHECCRRATGDLALH